VLSLGGPTPYYVNEEGKKLGFPQIGSPSEEARKHGVHGFWFVYWCPNCKVPVELDQPCKQTYPDPETAIAAGQATPRSIPRCGQCNGNVMPGLLEDVCPQCGGDMQTKEYIT
jgi:Zn finger protein HypA/HybF involved in hydrogenase expression